jgi:cyclin B
VASAPTPGHPRLPDIDAIDRENPLAATTYVNDLYSYYRRVEPRFQVPSNYMEQQVRCCAIFPHHQHRQPMCATPTLLTHTCRPSQEDITIKMRNILVDWLVDVHFKFKVRPWACPVSSCTHPTAACSTNPASHTAAHS